jgi:hypothetical protein
MIMPGHVRSSGATDRAYFSRRVDVVERLTFSFRAIGAVGQKRSNVRGLESKKLRNICGLGFQISVELRLNAVKRSHSGATLDAFDRPVPFRRAHLAPFFRHHIASRR